MNLQYVDGSGNLQDFDLSDIPEPYEWLEYESLFDHQFEEHGTFPSFISARKIRELRENCWKDEGVRWCRSQQYVPKSPEEVQLDYERKMVCWTHYLPWLESLREKALTKRNGARILKELDDKADELAEEAKQAAEQVRRERAALRTMSLEESRKKQKEWCQKQKVRREQRKTIVNIKSNVSALKWVKKDLTPEPVASEGAVPHATEACD